MKCLFCNDIISSFEHGECFSSHEPKYWWIKEICYSVRYHKIPVPLGYRKNAGIRMRCKESAGGDSKLVYVPVDTRDWCNPLDISKCLLKLIDGGFKTEDSIYDF